MADTEEEINGLDEGDDKALIQARAQRRLAARAREVAELKAREEAEIKAREEAERLAKEQAELQAREAARAEAELKIREEAERIAREEAERKAKEEAEREAKRRAREEAELRAREAAERRAREEAEAEERERAEIEARVRAMAEARDKEEEEIKKKATMKYQYRRSFSWSSVVLGALAVLVVLPLVLLHVLSLNMLIPTVEKLASEWMHEPVAIASVRASLWPTPHLTLENVAVGMARDVKIPALRVMPELASLFDENKIVKSVEVEALVVDQDSFGRIPGWLGGDTKQVRIGRIVLNNVKVGVKDVDLPPFAGEVILADDGKFKSAHFRNLDRKLEMDVKPSGAEFELSLTATGWQPPLGPKLVLDDLVARAVVNRQGMKVSEISARLYGGQAKGNALVSWDRSLRAEGDFELERVELDGPAGVLASDIALSGKLDAKLAYTLEAGKLPNLFESPRIKADFSCRDGSIGTLDLAHALQSRAREYVGNGKTGYETLSGTMVMVGNRYQFRQLRLNAGLLKASGDADVSPNKDLTGKIGVEMQLKSSAMRSHFAVSGSLKRIVLKRAD